jgi:hypothetical protein
MQCIFHHIFLTLLLCEIGLISGIVSWHIWTKPFYIVFQEDMKKNTMMMVEQSKVLKTPGAEKKTKRELFDALRQELE